MYLYLHIINSIKILIMSDTINKKWFKNRLKNNELVVKCCGKYSDDYALDAANNFSKTNEFKEPSPRFTDRFIDASVIWGDKNGIINLSFASCEDYEFKLKTI